MQALGRRGSSRSLLGLRSLMSPLWCRSPSGPTKAHQILATTTRQRTAPPVGRGRTASATHLGMDNHSTKLLRSWLVAYGSNDASRSYAGMRCKMQRSRRILFPARCVKSARVRFTWVATGSRPWRTAVRGTGCQCPEFCGMPCRQADGRHMHWTGSLAPTTTAGPDDSRKAGKTKLGKPVVR